MKVTANQIKRGLAAYISSEIMPALPGGTLKRMAVGTVLDLFLDNVERMIEGGDPMALALLGIKDQEGGIDLHHVAEKVKSNITDEGTRIDLNLLCFKLGDMVLHRSDVDALVRHILNA